MLGRLSAAFLGGSLICTSAAAQVSEGVAAEHQVETARVAPDAQVRREADTVKVGDTIHLPALPERGVESSGTRPASGRRWYGAPILIVDAASYGCFLAAASSDALAPMAAPGVVGYLLGGPITHLAHGNWGRAGLSVLARGALPIVTAAAASCEPDSGDCVSNALSLAAVGMVAATVLDTALLASEPEPAPASSLSARPVLSLSADHAFLGATGRF
jgi:hypothetical protein